MTPLEEQQSLVANPLPQETITQVPADDSLPSRILALDRQIEEMEKGIQLARETRAALMDRAILFKVGKDTEAIIIRTEKQSNREIDPALFKEKAPQFYEQCRQIEIANEKAKILKKIDDLSKLEVIDAPIRIQTAKTILSEDEISSICKPRQVTISYEVIPATQNLPKGAKLLTEGTQ